MFRFKNQQVMWARHSRVLSPLRIIKNFPATLDKQMQRIAVEINVATRAKHFMNSFRPAEVAFEQLPRTDNFTQRENFSNGVMLQVLYLNGGSEKS